MKIESAGRSGAVPSNSDLPADVCDIIRRALGGVTSLNDVLKEELCANVLGSKLLQVWFAIRLHTVLSNELADGDAYRYEIGVNREEASIAPAIPDSFSFTLSENLPTPWFRLSPERCWS